MLFKSISIFAILAPAFAAPSSPPTYSNQPTNVAPTYSSNTNAYTTIQTFHTEVYHWTAELNATRDAYISCSTDEERTIYKTQLQSQFSSLQKCVQSTQKYISAQDLKRGDNDEESEKYVRDVRDCVQEIKYTGQGLIPVLGHDVVAPLLIGVVKSLHGLLGVLLPLVGGLLEVVFELLANLLDLLF